MRAPGRGLIVSCVVGKVVDGGAGVIGCLVVGPGGGPSVKEAGSSDSPSIDGTNDGWG